MRTAKIFIAGVERFIAGIEGPATLRSPARLRFRQRARELASSRVALLRRTFDVDVTRCTGCAGRMTVRAVVTDPASIDRLFAALRRARDPPVAA